MNLFNLFKHISGFILLAFAMAAGPERSAAQTISTFAGNGTAAYSGDGGAATSAALSAPVGVAVDGSGNVFIADYNNNRVRKVNTSAVITTFAGNGIFGSTGDGGPATAANVNPTNIGFDGSGNVYFPDNSMHTLRKVNSVGVVSTIAGTGWPGSSGDGGPATAANLELPKSATSDGSGNIYIADMANHKIRKINSSGIVTTIAGTGAGSYSGDAGPATAAQLRAPYHIAIDGPGNLYIADFNNHRIRMINTAGVISTIAGTGVAGYSGDGVSATEVQLWEPIAVAVDVSGNIYIADRGNNRIRKVNSLGIITTIAGTGIAGYSGDGGPATAAQLNRPTGVAVDGSGNMYIADRVNNRIRMIATPSSSPVFDGGSRQLLAVCVNSGANSISSLLLTTDPGIGLVETYSVTAAPAHGTVTPGTAITSGTSVSPAGWTYIPATGYTGIDSFTIQVNNGFHTSNTVINVTVNPLPTAGTITGIDSLCPGHTTTLVNTATGGVWSSYNATIATVGSTGIVTGIAPGIDTIYYSVTTSCGTALAKKVLIVRSSTACIQGVAPVGTANDYGITLFPNPATGAFTMKLSAKNEEEVHVVISNAVGEKTDEFTTTTNKETPMHLNVAAGIYILSAQTAHDVYMTKLIIH